MITVNFGIKMQFVKRNACQSVSFYFFFKPFEIFFVEVVHNSGVNLAKYGFGIFFEFFLNAAYALFRLDIIAVRAFRKRIDTSVSKICKHL